MTYIREETVGSFTEAELLKMVKENLDKLGIAYEEKPGGFGGSFFLDPSIFMPLDCTESVTVTTNTSYRRYRPQNSITCDLELSFTHTTWSEDRAVSNAA